MQEESSLGIVRIPVEVVDARSVERRRSPDQAMYLVTLLDEKLGEVGAVLAGDAGDEGSLCVGGSHMKRVALSDDNAALLHPDALTRTHGWS